MNGYEQLTIIVKWNLKGIKEQYKYIKNYLNKLFNSPLGGNDLLLSYSREIESSYLLLFRFDKCFFSMTMTKDNLRRIYDLYLYRSALHFKNSTNFISLLKKNNDFVCTVSFKEIYSKSYNVYRMYDELLKEYLKYLR